MAPFFTGVGKNLGGFGFGREAGDSGPSLPSVDLAVQNIRIIVKLFMHLLPLVPILS